MTDKPSLCIGNRFARCYFVVGELSSMASKSSSSVGMRLAAIRRCFPISKKM